MNEDRDEQTFMRVSYTAHGATLIADVVKADFDRITARIASEGWLMRRTVKRSVKKALDEAARLMADGYTFSDEEIQDMANDVGIWLAYEVFEKRAVFVPTTSAHPLPRVLANGGDDGQA